MASSVTMANAPVPAVAGRPSCAARLDPGGRKQSALPAGCPHPSPACAFPLPACTTKILPWVFSELLRACLRAISSVRLLSTGRNSVRPFAPDLLCNWHSGRQKGALRRWFLKKRRVQNEEPQSVSSPGCGLELCFAALLGSVSADGSGKDPSR